MGYQVAIIDALRDWGLTVRPVQGWQSRGGVGFEPHGHVIHHDVIGDQEGTHDTVPNIIIAGRPDLEGPLANFWLERDGDVHLCAAGRANHAGEGSWKGLIGNGTVWGTEMNNLGVPSDHWPEAQLEAMARLAAATADFSGFTAATVCGHKEWTTRKIDPHTIDMGAFRTQVALQEKEGLTVGQVQDIKAAVKDATDTIVEAINEGRREQTKALRRAVWAAQGKTSDEIDELEKLVKDD